VAYRPSLTRPYLALKDQLQLGWWWRPILPSTRLELVLTSTSLRIHTVVALPPPINHTVLAIWHAYEQRVAEQGNRDNYGIPISTIGAECDRQLWYALRWAHWPERIDGQKQRRFDTGNREEERLLDDLEAAGIVVERTDPATGQQYRVEVAGNWLRGKLDAQAIGVPEAPKTTHVVECKSHNDKSFKELTKKKLKDGKFDHWAQCQIYMHGLQLTRCLYIAVNKNTDELYAERVYYDINFAERAERRVQFLVQTDKAPPKLYDDPSKKEAFACQWCLAKPVCHDNAFARKNCRTCLSAEFRDNAVVWCTRFDKELDYEMQQKGCPSHLYLPSLVPGEQVDANATSVTYKLNDNSTWVDAI